MKGAKFYIRLDNIKIKESAGYEDPYIDLIEQKQTLTQEG